MKKAYYFLFGLLVGRWAYGPQYDFDNVLTERPDRHNPHGTDDTHCFI